MARIINPSYQPPGPSAAYRIGQAMQAGGQMLGAVGQISQDAGYAKDMEKLIGTLDQITQDDYVSQNEYGPEGEIATLGVSQDTANPISKMNKFSKPLKTESIEMPETGMNALRSDETASPALAMQTAGAPEMQGAPMAQPMMGESGPQGVNQLRQEDPRTVQTKKTISQGMLELINQGVPQKEIQKALLQQQLISAQAAKIAAKWGKTDIANQYLQQFMNAKLDYFKNKYGAESQRLSQLLKYMDKEESRQLREDLAKLTEKGKTERSRYGQAGDLTKADLKSLTAQLNAVQNNIRRREENYMEVPELLYIQEQELIDQLGKLRERRGVPKPKQPDIVEKVPFGPQTAEKQAKISIQERIQAYVDQGMEPTQAAIKVRQEDLGNQ